MLDNTRLRRLRRDLADGVISPSELKRTVLNACQKMPPVDIHLAVGDELGLIENKGLRDFMYDLLQRIPRYFWHVPASVMGFHDTGTDNLMGGLVRHSKKVARVAQRIGEPYGLGHYADDLVVTGLLHDSFKYGLEGTVPREYDHATFAAYWYESNNIFNDRPHIRGMIATHLGKWGRAKPACDLDWAFHISDYVVSRGAAPNIRSARYHVWIPPEHGHGHGHGRR